MTASSDRQVVVVTGASAGVGRAVAQAFAERGARVGLLARGERGLEAARSEVESFGGGLRIAGLAPVTQPADRRFRGFRGGARGNRDLQPLDGFAGVQCRSLTGRPSP